ncbi:serine/threonine-protein kinase [Bailinhaonella thermotolerans]|uniref:Serine/threonine protein kinase n=1 Tax=Bailinhaonella thermotolerans TaxID=1070861 RepID=A0A3A4ALF4_9ACTN|nr:serine/threonine-protein kinase [Bailinhaonella thermotolerans]RJL26623.1 serine/threonine protein kinase [Bailinhaonella thermotolerans]
MTVRPLRPHDPRELGGYELLGVLGEGGQGIVYQGRGPSGDLVAIKLLRGEIDDKARERLSRELSAVRRVALFCTAQVLDARVDGPSPYVVSEYVEGPTLEERVARSGPLTGGQLERLAVGTASALAAIHAAGVVHRDFKPANVILGPDGPRVVDFGIARPADTRTATTAVVGTPAYLAPEQLNGEIHAASDVFAWAGTIIYAATGHPAFPDAQIPVLFQAILTAAPDLSDVPGSWRPLLERCLAKDPTARPTASELMLHLVNPATTTTPFAPPAAGGRTLVDAGNTAGLTAVDLTPPARSRSPLLLAGAAAVLLAAAATIAFWLTRPSDPPQATPSPTPTPSSTPVSPEVPAERATLPPQATQGPGPDLPIAPADPDPMARSGPIPPEYVGQWQGRVRGERARRPHEGVVTLVLSEGNRVAQIRLEGDVSCTAAAEIMETRPSSLAFSFPCRTPSGENYDVQGKLQIQNAGGNLRYRVYAPRFHAEGDLSRTSR